MYIFIKAVKYFSIFIAIRIYQCSLEDCLTIFVAAAILIKLNGP